MALHPTFVEYYKTKAILCINANPASTEGEYFVGENSQVQPVTEKVAFSYDKTVPKDIVFKSKN